MWETCLKVCLKKSRTESWCSVLRKKLYRNAPLSPQEYRRVPMRDIREAPNIRGGGREGGGEWKLQQAGIAARGCRNSPCYFKNPT